MTTAPQTTQASGVTALAFVRNMLTQMLETLSDEQMLHQPVPGGNHALWIIGHLAVCDDMMRSMAGGGSSKASEEWTALFKDGSQPQPEASAYPPIAEVKAALEEWRQDLLDWFDSMDDAALLEPLDDEWKEFAPTRAALIASIAAHEAMHVGQLTVVRKSLSMKPVMA